MTDVDAMDPQTSGEVNDNAANYSHEEINFIIAPCEMLLACFVIQHEVKVGDIENTDDSPKVVLTTCEMPSNKTSSASEYGTVRQILTEGDQLIREIRDSGYNDVELGLLPHSGVLNRGFQDKEFIMIRSLAGPRLNHRPTLSSSCYNSDLNAEMEDLRESTEEGSGKSSVMAIILSSPEKSTCLGNEKLKAYLFSTSLMRNVIGAEVKLPRKGEDAKCSFLPMYPVGMAQTVCTSVVSRATTEHEMNFASVLKKIIELTLKNEQSDQEYPSFVTINDFVSTSSEETLNQKYEAYVKLLQLPFEGSPKNDNKLNSIGFVEGLSKFGNAFYKSFKILHYVLASNEDDLNLDSLDLNFEISPETLSSNIYFPSEKKNVIATLEVLRLLNIELTTLVYASTNLCFFDDDRLPIMFSRFANIFSSLMNIYISFGDGQTRMSSWFGFIFGCDLSQFTKTHPMKKFLHYAFEVSFSKKKVSVDVHLRYDYEKKPIDCKSGTPFDDQFCKTALGLSTLWAKSKELGSSILPLEWVSGMMNILTKKLESTAKFRNGYLLPKKFSGFNATKKSLNFDSQEQANDAIFGIHNPKNRKHDRTTGRIYDNVAHYINEVFGDFIDIAIDVVVDIIFENKHPISSKIFGKLRYLVSNNDDLGKNDFAKSLKVATTTYDKDGEMSTRILPINKMNLKGLLYDKRMDSSFAVHPTSNHDDNTANKYGIHRLTQKLPRQMIAFLHLMVYGSFDDKSRGCLCKALSSTGLSLRLTTPKPDGQHLIDKTDLIQEKFMKEKRLMCQLTSLICGTIDLGNDVRKVYQKIGVFTGEGSFGIKLICRVGSFCDLLNGILKIGFYKSEFF